MTARALDRDRLRSAVLDMPRDALSDLRWQAVERFTQHGFPSTRDEDWRYTNLAVAVDISNEWLARSADDDTAAPVEAPNTGIDAHWIVISDGVPDSTLPESLASLRSHGVTIEVLSSGIDGPALAIDDPISSFNAALLKDGVRLHVADGVTIDKPIGFLVLDQANSAPGLSQFRLMIEVGKGARASFVQLERSTGEHAHFATSVVEMRLAEDAAAEFLRLQERAAGHVQTGQLRAHLDARATLRHGAVDVGGALVRNDLSVLLAGPAASASLAGAYLADGRQHIDNHLFADHAVGPAQSSQEYRGIAAGRARCVFNGKAVVRPGADGTDAVQSNHNLLLSDHAEIDTKPELEIYADDVKCSHGATVGQLDEKSLFYLRSRGLDRDDAIRLLTRAFAASVLSDLPVAAARDHVDRIIERKLGGMISEASA